MVKGNFSSEGGSSDGTNLQNLFMEAGQLHQNKNPRTAEEIYQLIRKAVSGKIRVPGNLGILYNELHRYADAEKCYAEALRTDPLDPSLHLNLGAVYEAQGDLTRANSSPRRPLAPPCATQSWCIYSKQGKNRDAKGQNYQLRSTGRYTQSLE